MRLLQESREIGFLGSFGFFGFGFCGFFGFGVFGFFGFGILAFWFAFTVTKQQLRILSVLMLIVLFRNSIQVVFITWCFGS